VSDKDADLAREIRHDQRVAALAMILADHVAHCDVCRMPPGKNEWHGVILCTNIQEWLNLHFPQTRPARFYGFCGHCGQIVSGDPTKHQCPDPTRPAPINI
jgi:hypothetical protein